MDTLPLLPDSLSSPAIAYRNTRPVSRAEFLSVVLAIADRLPNTGHIFNVCKDRYLFAATLFAAISRGILSILPNSTAPENLAALQAELPDLVCLGDQAHSPFHHLPYMRVSDVGLNTSNTAAVMPRIPFDQRVACVYTSGSTGKPQPHIKTFGRMYQCATAEAERLWAVAGGPCAVLGTVPFQHMYGLESSVLLPIFGGGQLSARLPFFPADVVAALAELPSPRLLVTTPFHLRKLMDAGIEIPPVATVLSATAPLSREMAIEVEARLGAPMMEIYGSTETGQLATRQPSTQIEWLPYPDIVLSQNQGITTATGGHLESGQILNDVVELISTSSFRLLGRNSDMINIVGKRSSLAFLNHAITTLPGVHDGVFCLPECNQGSDVSRLAAFVVAPELNPADIISGLLPQMDPVFLPRPIVFLDALPRNGNGKIPAAALSALIAEHISQRT
jgi:acyl-coenzyme A synthetase/AMP-(fatty) acid ligase